MRILKLQSYILLLKKTQKHENFAFFYKKVPKNFGSFRKSCTFAAHFEKRAAKSGCISAKSKFFAVDLH